MILVAGATGVVGSIAAQQLASRGEPVRALVRTSSDPAKVASLKSAGVELVVGDLRDAGSLKAACSGVRAVVSTVSCTLSRQEGDSIEATDRDGQLALVEAAEAAGVEHFVLVSFNEQAVDSPLERAKRAVEDRLAAGAMAWTVMRPTFFMEVWLSPALGFDQANRTVTIYGEGTVKHTWISVADVAAYVVSALTTPESRGRKLDIGGPQALSWRDAVRIFEQQVPGEPFTVQEMPEATLQQQYEQATDSLEKSFAALMLTAARGSGLDTSDAERILPLPSRRTVEQYADASR